MAKNAMEPSDPADRPARYGRELLVEQNLWLIRLRWIAAGGIMVSTLLSVYAFPYAVLSNTTPLYACAAVLAVSNLVYYFLATKKSEKAGARDVAMAAFQVEADLVVLTTVLHFSGGVVNPFFLFYIFHVIIATIILPRNLSFVVGMTTILLFGLLTFNELNEGALLGYYPLQLPGIGGLWKNPVYLAGTFVAFVCTVVLAQYLTRMIIARMTTKEMEAARNNDLLKAIITAMSEGLVFVTRDNQVAICNPAAESWKKKDRAGWNGDSLEAFPTALAEYVRGMFVGFDKAALANKVIEFTTIEPDKRHIEAKGSRVVGLDGKDLGYVVVGQDLTSHKRLETELLERTEEVTSINEMLKMSRVEMAQREKMVAIGQMATGIAHEIGNPLASLSSVVQYLGRKLSGHEEKEHLRLIEHEISRISDILKRMLSLSRPATAEYRWTDINEVVGNTLSLVKFDRRMRCVSIENVACPELPMVWLNPQLLEQVFLNIFINALDAMGAKKTEAEHILQVTAASSDGMIDIRVSDTGVGMSPEVCKRAFESFFTTKEIGKGTGLGLFISYNLVAEIDGTISLESELGRGTTVSIRIPIRPRGDLILSSEDGRSDSDR